jgi:hypothetical protein
MSPSMEGLKSFVIRLSEEVGSERSKPYRLSSTMPLIVIDNLLLALI